MRARQHMTVPMARGHGLKKELVITETIAVEAIILLLSFFVVVIDAGIVGGVVALTRAKLGG